MIIASNFLVRQKEWVQGEEEEETGDRRKGGPTGTPTPVAEALTGQSRSGVSDARNRRKHGRWCGVPLNNRERGGLRSVLSSHERNGGSYKRMIVIGKG